MRVSFTSAPVHQRIHDHHPQAPAAAVVSSPVPSASIPETGNSHMREDIASARSTALSALRNERFGSMLRQLTDPRASGSVALTRNEGATVDHGTALSRYAEFGE
jgi:hypothetical protein